MPGTIPQLAFFETVCVDPYATARKAAEEGSKVAAYMCTYTPEELFHAAGYFPMRLFGRNSGATNQADAHLPAYACGFLRSALDMALAGELGFVDLMVFGHTCDSMQNLADIWKHAVPNMKQLVITTPVVVGTEASIAYFREELARARARLDEIAGPVSDDAIVSSIVLYDGHRALMQRLYALRAARPGCLSGREMMAIVLASMLMPREEHALHLEALLGALDQDADRVVAAGKPKVIVIGNVVQNLDYAAVIEAAGCVVLDEDLCSGRRAFAMAPAESEDPLEQLARMYLTPAACPSKHQPGFDIGGALLERAQSSGAEGVVILLTKFCEPWCFDYPYLKEVFDKAGIPSLLIEIESNQPPSEQFRNRIHAFAEMLGAAHGG
ncbi:MAG TPA: 2-hydroxyacyl-CoA dehydratase family protein [Candidatus Hydrogenedentes bacterium]|nr:2-hydroxyacyl-CoA dehydratase family protein [Candidatus Hydrogenedentota bacterium]HPG67614.1 2-hydroxyacyl-CoA dehydratase family protein [Candidatus Hydrogenedentota bacterium]